MRRGRTSAVAAALVASMVGAQPAAADVDRQTVRDSLTTTLPNAPTGNRLEIEWRNPADPDAKPPAVDTIVIQMPRGSRSDFSTVPQCKASDLELMLRGTAGCPAASRISTGRTVVDTGSPGVFPRFLHVNTVMFNNEGEMIGVGETEEFPFRTVVRTKMQNERAIIPMPANPGGPPDFRSSFRSLRVAGPPIVRGDRALARTPPTCPASGYWTMRYTFIYHDGVRQRETTTAPCTRSANVRGTAGDDRLVGTPGDDVILCGAGDDYAIGRGGDDFIDCGAGNDRVNAGAGDDRVRAGEGDDFARGYSGADRLRGQRGNDRLGGGRGRDRIAGGAGGDRIAGNSSADRIFGGRGDDRLSGNGGRDRLRGERGEDRLRGGSGNDRLRGGRDDDRLRGNRGRDRLYGGLGVDLLDGGPGLDLLLGGPGDDRMLHR